MSQTLPCLFVDLPVVRANAQAMVELCEASGIHPVGITKLACGAPEVAEAFVEGGIRVVGDSRVNNLAKFKDLPVEKLLLRIPSVSNALDTVRYADVSLNSEPHTVRALSAAAVALGRSHKVIVMHDLGDLREGCFSADDTVALARLVTELPGLVLEGLGTNLACYGGVEPTTDNQQQLVDIAHRIERELGVKLHVVSGASSAALPLLLRGGMPEGVNQLRLGASLLMGIGLNDDPIPGTSQDTMRLGVEIVELKEKPSVPVNSTALDAFGNKPVFEDFGIRKRAICAIGKQDVNFDDLIPQDKAVRIIGGSSDHLILDVTDSDLNYQVGDTVYFALSYGGALQCMTSEYVRKEYLH
ncbi:alanine/ornithine racemase family PLP-dependent enzyme [Crenobacter caeni]|uniref:Alanine/ornithine racemase family PLP-dependent enzyme n=1 Tax=Crenobacter caeni TaxID=2705474 RepID=A0A6B2KRR4_9NEIS|nr:alanine/ornithine racemase family PLP-dependent enzyme [Crenobacter caeni]NDV12932.1 alanine/ornithine racemase family PLP-dependent enzyme [Crenobacter caeni]